ncbi:MAG: RNA-binding S4 domain-containing protein [Oscillospiraceae bacterium]|nr:RNA-binding S4 domain-containing protein [Oscillospiraceae bacterium]
MSEEISIKGDFIRLDALLKFTGASQTGGHAKIMIADGIVKVNGEVCTMRGKKLYPGDAAEVNGIEYKITVMHQLPKSL